MVSIIHTNVVQCRRCSPSIYIAADNDDQHAVHTFVIGIPTIYVLERFMYTGGGHYSHLISDY